MRRASAPLVLALLASACTMDPKYARPLPAVPPSWPAGSPVLAGDEATLPAVRHQDIFRDPALDRIIDRALANNQDLKAAAANIEIARGTYRATRAQIFPEIAATGGVTRRRTSGGSTVVTTPGTGGTGTGGTGTGTGTGVDPGTGVGTGNGGGTGVVTTGGGRTVNSYNVQAGLSSFEIDLFGRLRSLSAAALDEYFATEAAARATRLSLVAETASAYLTLATDRSLLAIAADTLASADRTVRLTEARLRGGIAPRTELRQAETVLRQAQADRAALVAQVQQDRNALELLVGQPVPDADLPPSIEAVDALIVPLPPGLDSRVLLRRPDVVQAEYALRAANARIGAARAAFFPTIGLTALAGLASTALSGLFSGDAFTYTLGGQAQLPIFDWGGRRGDLQAARGRFDFALADYQRTIQIAFRDVADALAVRATIADRFAAQAQLEAAARDTLTLQEARYREGIDPYLNTLDAQRTLYSARRATAQARLLRADNLVDLYRALGGDQLSGTADLRPRSATAAPRP